MATAAIDSQATSPSSSAAASALPSSAASAPIASTSQASAAFSQPAAPDKYDFKLPAGKTIDPTIVQRTEARARDRGLSNEAGQALLDGVLAELEAQDRANTTAWEPKKGAKWVEWNQGLQKQALADAEIGGSPEKLANHRELAQHALRLAFPTVEERKAAEEFLDQTGLSNHPMAIRLLSRFGKMSAERPLVTGQPGTGSGPKPMAQRMYPGDGTGPKPQSTTE